MPEPATTPALDIASVRNDFPILHKPLPNGSRLVFLDNASSTQKPQCVIDKEIETYSEYYANAYRGVYRFGGLVDDEIEGTRKRVASLIGAAEPEEVVFTSGTTMSINLVASGWGRKFLTAGDEVLVNEMEHHANLVPWQRITQETGASLKYLPLTDDGRLDLDQLDDILTDRTKLVAVTGMSNMLGTIPPIAEIAARAKQHGALVLVDGAQSVPHMPVDVTNPAIDFLAFSGHKLYGPSGIGVLYGRRELLEAMDPFLAGGHMIAEVHRDHSTWAELPAKFEAGTPPIAQAIALGTAIDYVTNLGFDAIYAHESRLLQVTHEKLSAVPGLTIYGPEPAHKGSIVSFTIEGMHPQDLAILLDRKGVAVRHGHHCTMPLHTLLGITATCRASFGIYNSEADIDVLLEGIEFARGKLRLT
jgi:cysteine desulfurase/selenocysteine lyase